MKLFGNSESTNENLKSTNEILNSSNKKCKAKTWISFFLWIFQIFIRGFANWFGFFICRFSTFYTRICKFFCFVHLWIFKFCICGGANLGCNFHLWNGNFVDFSKIVFWKILFSFRRKNTCLVRQDKHHWSCSSKKKENNIKNKSTKKTANNKNNSKKLARACSYLLPTSEEKYRKKNKRCT